MVLFYFKFIHKVILKVQFPLMGHLNILSFLFALTQLEKQVHEDEEFARTLSMLDSEPQTKKVTSAVKKNTLASCRR